MAVLPNVDVPLSNCIVPIKIVGVLKQSVKENRSEDIQQRYDIRGIKRLNTQMIGNLKYET